jgi:hypothetical protein
MLKKTSVVLAVLGICALGVFLLNCGSGSERPEGLLYIISQAENNISSYAINLDSGSLSLINSNATTCTTASGSSPQPCGLAVKMMLDPTGNAAFVLNQGFTPSSVAPTIYGYSINSDGSFGSPTTAATLSANPGETAITMTEDTGGDLLFVITNAPAIYVFAAKAGSPTLTQASVVSLTRVPTAISAITFTPQGGSTASTLLFMTSSKDLTPLHNDNELSVYSADSSGNLTEQVNSPYTVNGVNPTTVLSVNTQPPQQNTGGIFAYVGNQPGSIGTGSVTVFQVCTVLGRGPCTLPAQVQQQQLLPVGSPVAVGQNPVAMLVDPTNSFLYVTCSGSTSGVGGTGTGQVNGFKIAGGVGTLSTLTPANLPTGAQPVAMAIHGNYNGSGEFIYTSNQAASSITGFSVDATTGTMSGAGTTIFLLGQPSGLAAR